MKHKGFLFAGIFFFLNKKFPSFSMLPPSCLIIKKGERRRENGGSGFFGLKKQCEMVVLSFILHAPFFMLDY